MLRNKTALTTGGASGIGLASAGLMVEAGDLFLVGDLDDAARTSMLAEGERDALRAVADWIRGFMARPHQDLGRAGSVCPFVPGALEQDTIWLASERSSGRSEADIIRLIDGYRRKLLAKQPVEGERANHKAIVIVYTDLPAASAKAFFDRLMPLIGVPSYGKDGLATGPFYEGNDAPAIYNPSFRPFISPVPFLLMRNAVPSDWKFFLDDEEWFSLWVRRFGDSAAETLASELRRLPWRRPTD